MCYFMLNYEYITIFYIDKSQNIKMDIQLWRSFLWTSSVLLLLLIPYIFLYLSGLIIDIGTEDHHSFIKVIDDSAKQGSFIFISTGISSAAFIDFVFNERVNSYHTAVHVPILVLLLTAVALFSCIHIVNAIITEENNSFISLDYQVVIMLVRIHFFVCLAYAISIKWIIFSKEIDEK